MTPTPSLKTMALRRALDAAKARNAEHERNHEEAQHQVRNILGIVRALVRHSSEDRDRDVVEEHVGRLSGRVDALLRSQSTALSGTHETLRLEHLVSSELLVFRLGGENVKFDGEHVMLKAKAAGMVALICHDLAVQVIERGAVERGEALTISWKRLSGKGSPLELKWLEVHNRSFVDLVRRPDLPEAVCGSIVFALG